MLRWKRYLPFILINILISALTTLAVLWGWDQIQKTRSLPSTSSGLSNPAPAANEPMPPTDEPVIKIENVFGAGNNNLEAVRVVRVSREPIWLTGWQLKDENGNLFTFPELGLLQEGAFVEVYSRSGHNTPFELYWNRDKAIWSTGETARVIDRDGNLRAEFKIP